MAKVTRQASTACRTRPLQATQPADSPPGTGLKETTTSRWPASQQKQQPQTTWPPSRRAVQVDGGSAVVLAARKAGADLPDLSRPHLSPLPVTVLTHSLNFEKTQFSPKFNFFLLFLFYF